MSDIQNAYLAICKAYGEKFTVMSCRDYGSFYGFFLGPKNWDPSKPTFVGRELFCVDKRTKKVETKDVSDLSGTRWTPVPVRAIV